MSIYSAMRAGVTGLNANSSAMAVISDNIANLNTVGYKRGQTDFSAVLNAQNASTSYNAGGVLASSRRFIDLQGALQQADSATDLAINGNGFFIVTEDPSGTSGAGGGLFTRAGSFSLDAKGLLRNAQGYYLMGAPMTTGTSASISPSSLASLQVINLSNVGSTAEASTKAAVNANLDSREDIYAGTPAYAAGAMAAYPAGTGAIAPQVERSIEIYDSLGTARTLTMGFLKTGTNTWATEIYMRPAADVTGTNGLVASGSIAFSSSGVPTTVSPALQGFSITYATTVGAAAQPMTLDLTTGLSQYATPSALNSATADGSPPGDLSGVTISDAGVLTAQYSNGRSEALYLIPVATFLNPNGLEAERGGAYRVTLDSGQFTINSAGSGGAGPIQSNALEASNVDLGSEFTSMITTQRAYSACSKIITTADDMLDELIRIKR
jgi:flagellar hook protein FlgE